MKSLKRIMLLAALPVFSGTAFAESLPSFDAKDLSVIVNLKVWANEWQTWNDPNGTGSFGTGTAAALNPSITLKYRNWFVSGGFTPETSYDIPNTQGGTKISAKRKEMDLAAGYYIHPQVALTFGYKQITQIWGSTEYKWAIPAVGLSAASALQDTQMFVYGSAAVGYSSVSTSDATASTWDMKGGMYTISEIGTGYAVSQKFRVTVGYKVQSSPTSMIAVSSTDRVTLMDSTSGFVFGGSYLF